MSRQRALESASAHPEQAHGDSDGPDLLRQIDVCARLGISDQTWMNWRKAGRTPEPVRMPSGRLKWRREDIDAITRRRRAEPPRRYFQSASRHGVTVRPIQDGANPHAHDGQPN